MKSLTTYVFTSAVCLLTTASLFAQHVVPAISLGDPIPAYQADPNVVRVSGSSCNGCSAKLDFQACCEPTKGCAGGCKDSIVTVACTGDCKAAAPACAVAAKPAPCNACDVHKFFQRAPAAACSTCSAPAPAPAPAACNAGETKKWSLFHTPAPTPCKTCAAPAPAPAACAPCAAKPVCQVAKPAPCNTCSTPAPAPAPCATCDSCKAHAHTTESHRPILEAVKNFFSSPGHHAAPAKADGCTTCAASATNPAAAMVPIQPIPMQSSAAIPQTSSYQPPTQNTAPVPAALAPYAAQAPFTSALPPAEVNLPPR